METGNKLKRFAVGIAALGLVGSVQFAHAVLTPDQEFSDLYPTWDFDLLVYNTPNVSSGAFNGGYVGVVNGNWVQTGGDSQQQSPENVILSTGFVNNGNPGNNVVVTTTYNNALLASAWMSATNSSVNFAAEAASSGLTYSALNLNQQDPLSISESTVGNYVVDINGNVTLNQSSITVNAPAGSTFLINISGDVVLNGGSSGGLLAGGGLTANDVVWNILGTGTGLSTSGGGNAQEIDGTVMVVNGMFDLSQVTPVGITGELITSSLQESSNSMITYAPVPEPAPMALLAVSFGLFGIWRARWRKV